jgi:glycosyltransferase involved in cell wall biosynthesis
MLNTTAATRGNNAPRILHIFNGFQNPHGGSELEALALYDLLASKSEVRLWATSSKVSKELRQRYPMRRVAMHKGDFPRGGTYIFVGAHWRNKLWPYFVPRPRRLIYIYNTFHPKVVALTSKMPRLLGWPPTEYVLISAFQSRLAGVQGEIHSSPIDIALFRPETRAAEGGFADGGVADGAVVIGRMSRDVVEKHHPEDIDLYRELIRQGFEVRLQGAACLSDQLSAIEGVQWSPEGAMPAPAFLRSLDVFYYRTGAHVETFGRVVFEAMACGLPVVCHQHGGYADTIRHGENGFLFDTTAEARLLLERLAADPALRSRVGGEARRTVEKMYSKAAQDERLAFYLR